jgi:hypothetical protein
MHNIYSLRDIKRASPILAPKISDLALRYALLKPPIAGVMRFEELYIAQLGPVHFWLL